LKLGRQGGDQQLDWGKVSIKLGGYSGHHSGKLLLFPFHLFGSVMLHPFCLFGSIALHPFRSFGSVALHPFCAFLNFLALLPGKSLKYGTPFCVQGLNPLVLQAKNVCNIGM
jgi:hypothetical protein